MKPSSYEVRNGRLVRTAYSLRMNDIRRAFRALRNFRLINATPAQDRADELHLSRSKPYPNKGRRERMRRMHQALMLEAGL